MIQDPSPLQAIILELDKKNLDRTAASLEQVTDRITAGVVPSGVMYHVVRDVLETFPPKQAAALLSNMLNQRAGQLMLMALVAGWMQHHPDSPAKEFIPLLLATSEVLVEHTRPNPIAKAEYCRFVVQAPF